MEIELRGTRLHFACTWCFRFMAIFAFTAMSKCMCVVALTTTRERCVVVSISKILRWVQWNANHTNAIWKKYFVPSHCNQTEEGDVIILTWDLERKRFD